MSTYRNPVRVHMGAGSLGDLGAVIGDRTAVLVTSRGTLQRLDARIRELLGDRLVATSAGVEPNPTVASCLQVHEEVAGAASDVVLAIGGGSVLDTAKAVAAQRAGLELDPHLRRGGLVPEGFGPPPIVAVPTTAGTGSEVTPWATIWDEREPRKHSLDHPCLFPETALLDPELTLTLPEEPTVTAGLDALSHAMEAIWNRNANPVSDALASKAISMIPGALRRVLAAPAEIADRERLQLASLFAGLAFSNTRTALAHSISYPLTASLGLAHGLACSFTLAEILELNARADGDRCAVVARALGTTDPQEASARIYRLFADVGLSASIQGSVRDRRSIEEMGGTLITADRASNNLAQVSEVEARRLLLTAYDAVCGTGDAREPTPRRGPREA